MMDVLTTLRMIRSEIVRAGTLLDGECGYLGDVIGLLNSLGEDAPIYVGARQARDRFAWLCFKPLPLRKDRECFDVALSRPGDSDDWVLQEDDEIELYLGQCSHNGRRWTSVSEVRKKILEELDRLIEYLELTEHELPHGKVMEQAHTPPADKSKKLSVNARLIDLLQKKPESNEWSAREFAQSLGCAPSTVHATKTWKLLNSERNKARERLLEKTTTKDGKGKRRSLIE